MLQYIDFNKLSLGKVDIKKLTRIDAETAEILASAQAAKTFIIDQHQKQKAENAPLYVLNGETHYNPAAYLHHLFLLQLLKEEGLKVSVGYEVEHDYLAQELTESVPKLKTLSYHFHSAAHARDHYDCQSCLLSRRELFAYLAAQHKDKCVVPIFNDASCTPFDDLDLADDVTFEAVKQLGVNHMQPVSVLEQDGLYVRNHVMTEFLSAHADEHKSDIAFQVAGTFHIAGGVDPDSRDLINPEHSMAALLNKQGRSVITLYTDPYIAGRYNHSGGEFQAFIPEYMCDAEGRLFYGDADFENDMPFDTEKNYLSERLATLKNM